MKDCEMTRVGRHTYLITKDPAGLDHTDHKTINAAKRYTHTFQKTGGTAGDGRVRVVSSRKLSLNPQQHPRMPKDI